MQRFLVVGRAEDDLFTNQHACCMSWHPLEEHLNHRALRPDEVCNACKAALVPEADHDPCVYAVWHPVPSGREIQHSELCWCLHKQLRFGGGRAIVENVKQQFWEQKIML